MRLLSGIVTMEAHIEIIGIVGFPLEAYVLVEWHQTIYAIQRQFVTVEVAG